MNLEIFVIASILLFVILFLLAIIIMILTFLLRHSSLPYSRSLRLFDHHHHHQYEKIRYIHIST